jgi:tetratricopeptide (TPR) repeat protein
MFGAAKRWRPLFFLYGFALVNAISVIAFYVFARYRLPSVPPLLIFASLAVSLILEWFKTKSWGRFSAAGIGVAALCWFLAPKGLPLMSSSLANLGTAYRLLGQPEKAISTLQEAIRLSPDMPETHFVLANLYMGRNDYDQAIPEYQRAVSLDPRQTEALYLIGVAYFNRKDFKHARQAWMDVLRQQPTHPEALKGIQILEKSHL